MVKRMLFWAVSVAVILSSNSCEFEEPDISDLKNFKLIKMDGNTIDVQFDVDINNPNGMNFKIKGGDVDLQLNDEEVGTIKLSEKIKVIKKKENTYTVPLRLDLKPGILFKLIKISQEEEIILKAKGTVKGSVLGFSKKFDVNETKNLSGADLAKLLIK